jgi:hypothetical protein
VSTGDEVSAVKLAVHGRRFSVAGSAGPEVCTSDGNEFDGDRYGIGCAAGNDRNDRDPVIHPGEVAASNFKDDDCKGCWPRR